MTPVLPRRVGGTGRRSGLKIRRPHGHTGSIPVPGTSASSVFGWGAFFYVCSMPTKKTLNFFQGLRTRLGFEKLSKHIDAFFDVGFTHI